MVNKELLAENQLEELFYIIFYDSHGALIVIKYKFLSFLTILGP